LLTATTTPSWTSLRGRASRSCRTSPRWLLAAAVRALQAVAERLCTTPLAVALAWLLQRSPNILLIPGTSSVAHLRENVAGAALELPADAIAEFDAISH
jgi:aryl-alcohol dehydrogenase-like predicted oxidoreductase